MTTSLPAASSLLSALSTLEQSLAQFEEGRAALLFNAANGEATIQAVADGLGRLRSVTITPSLMGSLTPGELAAKVKDVVNAALASANAAGASATSDFANTLSLPGLPSYGSAAPDYAMFGSMAERITSTVMSNQPCQSSRTFECRAGRVVATLSAQRVVTSLVYEAPLPDYIAHLESRTVEAINCAIDEATDRPNETTDVTDSIIGSSATFSQLVLYANGVMQLADRVAVKTPNCANWALIANAGSGEINIGVTADVGNIISRGHVMVRDRGRVHGSILTTDVLDTQNLTEIDGPVTENGVVVLPELAFNVQFPTTTIGNIAPEPDVVNPATSPGYYDKLHPKSRSQVFLTSGVYYVNEFFIEPEATVWIDTTGGPVIIWVRDSFTFHGSLVDSSGGFPRLFIGYMGAAMAAVECNPLTCCLNASDV